MLFATNKRRSTNRKYKGRSRIGSRPSGRRGNKNRFPWMTIGGIVACVAGAAVGGYAVLQDASTAKADDIGCFVGAGSNAVTYALIDASDPAFDTIQARDLINGFSNEFRHELLFNERFFMATTQEKVIGSILNPILELCRPAKSPSDLEGVGAASATQAYVSRQSEKVFTEEFLPKLIETFSADAAGDDRQSRESPILEQIQSVSKDSNFVSGIGARRLIVVSDLIQNTTEIQFCSTQGHLPSFARFKEKPEFERIAPSSLSDVEVEIFMLLRHGFGSGSLAYCTEDELRNFWTEYFMDAGARSVEITRLRPGS